jgi:hypothetical protein
MRLSGLLLVRLQLAAPGVEFCGALLADAPQLALEVRQVTRRRRVSHTTHVGRFVAPDDVRDRGSELDTTCEVDTSVPIQLHRRRQLLPDVPELKQMDTCGNYQLLVGIKEALECVPKYGTHGLLGSSRLRYAFRPSVQLMISSISFSICTSAWLKPLRVSGSWARTGDCTALQIAHMDEKLRSIRHSCRNVSDPHTNRFNQERRTFAVLHMNFRRSIRSSTWSQTNIDFFTQLEIRLLVASAASRAAGSSYGLAVSISQRFRKYATHSPGKIALNLFPSRVVRATASW